MADIFNRTPLNISHPITADMVMINWGGVLARATNFSLQYNQPVQRRWTLGGAGANSVVIYPGRPIGTIQIQRLFVDSVDDIFTKPGFSPCGDTATIYLLMNGASSVAGCTTTGGEYIVRGGVVTSYGFTAEADSLTVVDNITVEFMQLDYNNSSTTTPQ